MVHAATAIVLTRLLYPATALVTIASRVVWSSGLGPFAPFGVGGREAHLLEIRQDLAPWTLLDIRFQ